MNHRRKCMLRSLCWKCLKANGGFGCPWIDDKPSGRTKVKGWKTETKMHNNGEVSTIVLSCPLYEKDIEI